MTIDRDKAQPVFRQIYDILLAEIEAGLYSDKGMLPSEKNLCERYDVERNTVRKALQILVNERRVIRQRGSGTKIVPLKANQQALPISDQDQAQNCCLANGCKWVVGVSIAYKCHFPKEKTYSCKICQFFH